MENIPAGIVSIGCHIGVFIWLSILLWQIRLREEMMASNAAIIDNNKLNNQHKELQVFNFKMLVVAALFLLASYTVMLLEAYISYSRQYLIRFTTSEGAVEYIQHQRLKVPNIYWTLDTFRNQSARPTTTLQRNKILNKYTRKECDENEPDKVTAVFDVPYKKVIDVSGDIKSFRPGVMTRVSTQKLSICNKYSLRFCTICILYIILNSEFQKWLFYQFR